MWFDLVIKRCGCGLLLGVEEYRVFLSWEGRKPEAGRGYDFRRAKGELRRRQGDILEIFANVFYSCLDLPA